MSKPDPFPQGRLRPCSTTSLAPLLYMLGRLKDEIGEKEIQQLWDDLVAFSPQAVRREPCAGRPPVVNPAAYPQAREPFLPSPAEKPESEPEKASLFSLDDYTDDALFGLQETFVALQEYYPLRAASLYLRFLCRIWVGLVEEGKQELMADAEFIRLYLDAMLRVEAIAGRCASCELTEDVGLQQAAAPFLPPPARLVHAVNAPAL